MKRHIVAQAAATVAGILWLSHAAVAAPSEDVLKTLRPGHPRLFATQQDWLRVKAMVAKDPLAKKWFERLQADAAKMLKQQPVERKLIGPRLLDKSRTALGRIGTLAGLYQLTGDRKYADRALKEMLTVAAFSDWNPSHFLDVAEMTTAMAIGYDWLFDYLTADDRVAIRTAIVEKGLKPSLPVYQKRGWWAKATHNWNQVCNGGMTVGALAVADEERALAASIVDYGRNSIRLAMTTFGPDGGWPEGPGYWAYATIYNVYYLAALQTALGTDFGLNKIPGFVDTGLFRIHFTGPTGLTFNYADAHEKAGSAPQMFWFGREFGRTLYTGHEIGMTGSRGSIFHLLWFAGKADGPRQDTPQRDAIFRGVDVAFLRSDWKDPKAFFIGFKGGDNKANHSHLDLGSFVFDALGERWALDLGSDEYNLPGYFGKQRWTYFRLRTESHNTLTLDGENQNVSGKAPLVAFHSSPARSFAVADLTDGYKNQASQVLRGIALLARKQVLVQDEVTAQKPVEVRWNFLTRATIEPSGDKATLSQGSAKLVARILSPAGAKFEVLPANPPPPQHQQPNVHNLSIRLPAKTAQARIAVLFEAADDSSAAPKLDGLDNWIASGKLDSKP